jgi:hypothetical protein
VSIEAIQKLLAAPPPLKVITLHGVPLGAPGVAGPNRDCSQSSSSSG